MRKLPYWLLAVLLIAVMAGWLVASNADYRRIFGALIQGVGVTLYVTAIAFSLAMILGLLIALASHAKSRALRELARFYVEIMRGIPVLVLLFYIAFVGAPQLVTFYNWAFSALIGLEWLPSLTTRDFDMIWRAILALTLSYAAFISEIFRAGILSVPRGQSEAAASLGLTRLQAFSDVIMPQAVRNILPPLGNDFVAMIKDSALVSALGVQDVTQLGKVYAASTFLFFETYNIVAFLYLTMTIGLSLIVRALEHRLRRSA